MEVFGTSMQAERRERQNRNSEKEFVDIIQRRILKLSNIFKRARISEEKLARTSEE